MWDRSTEDGRRMSLNKTAERIATRDSMLVGDGGTGDASRATTPAILKRCVTLLVLRHRIVLRLPSKHRDHPIHVIRTESVVKDLLTDEPKARVAFNDYRNGNEPGETGAPIEYFGGG